MGSSPTRRWVDSSTLRSDRRDPYLSIQHVMIFVRDQDRSLRFYLNQLGFGLVLDNRFEGGGRWVAVAPPDGTAILALVSPKPGSEEYRLIGRSRQVVLVTEDVTAKFNDWSKRGVRFHHPPRTVEWGGIFTSFEDLDGNRFALVGFDEMGREIEAQRRAVGEKLESERRAAQELGIAKQVQARLFPQKLPSMKTLEYTGTCVQAWQVGGDYYDFLELRPGRLALVLADIAGKGVPGALLMANLQANLRSQYAMAVDDLPRLLTSVNRLFYENTDDASYATLFFADYEDSSRRLRYVNCGHLPPVLMRASGSSQQKASEALNVEWLHSTCTVMGLFKEWQCKVAEVRLAPGDTLIIYTDGITEAARSDGEEFGGARFVDILRRRSYLPIGSLLQALVGAVQQFTGGEQQDDITIVIARSLA